MKTENIMLRVTKEQKDEFREWCDYLGKSMSRVLLDYMRMCAGRLPKEKKK